MINVQRVLKQLRAERERAVREVEKLDAAINALASSNGFRLGGKSRRLSASARRRIALAQKARWAKFRAQRRAGKKAA